ncbi:MAG TPA: WhiB family transcriptional regulator [Mycobacteriales bacterium]|nr:WhiB family transcriptional regulator [Mycobacteriales bacterium]
MTAVNGRAVVAAAALFPAVRTHADAVRQVWESALCAQVDPEVFFPEKGQSPDVAKAVCAACPATALCLATFGPLLTHGVVGGLSAEERRSARRADRERAAA